jgi:serine/threonine protein kinase
MVDVRTATPIVGIPPRLGKYRIIGQLGRGGMADLYLAVTSGIGGFSKLHVLKLVRSDSFDNEMAVQMFVNEARVTALLNHPNVVQTHEVGEDNGMVFMVMEFLEGQSLDLILSRSHHAGAGGLNIGARLRIVSDVLNGLHHAHELRDLEGQPLNLVHRDVTPHNIFVTYDGGIKLLDFGVAKTTSMSSPTRVGTIKGKVAYMAPEQVNNPGQVTRATDIFQIGLLLWEGVIGREIWQGLSEYEVLLKLSSNSALPFVPPPDADPELVTICRRATAIIPKERYVSAEDFNRDIESYMIARGISVAAKQVGNYVAGLFEQQRREVRDAIQRHLKDIQVEPVSPGSNVEGSPTPIVPNLISSQTQSGSGHFKSLGTGSLNGTSSRLSPGSSSASHIAPTKPKWGWSKIAFSALIVGAALIGGLLALVVDPRRTTDAQGPTARPVAATPIEKQSEQIQLFVEAIPANARIYLDDRLLPSNPFSGRMPRDGAVHLVRAEAEGHEKASLLLRFDGDTKNVLKLPAIEASATPNAVSLSPSPRKVSVTPSRIRPSVRTNIKSASPPQNAMGIQSTSPSVKLDNSDPWR